MDISLCNIIMKSLSDDNDNQILLHIIEHKRDNYIWLWTVTRKWWN